MPLISVLAALATGFALLLFVLIRKVVAAVAFGLDGGWSGRSRALCSVPWGFTNKVAVDRPQRAALIHIKNIFQSASRRSNSY